MFFLSLKNKSKSTPPPTKHKTQTLFCIEQLLITGLAVACEYTQCDFSEENRFSLSQKLSVGNSVVARSGALCPCPLLHSGSSSDLSLCGSCISCQRISEFMCLSSVLCLENAVFLNHLLPLAFIVSPLLFSMNSWDLRGEVRMKTSRLGLSNSEVSHCCMLSRCESLWITISCKDKVPW